MSPPLISRSPDLQRLVDDGYAVAVIGGYLVVSDVPYVDRNRRVRKGALVCHLALAGDRTVRPSDHQAWFQGDRPCDVHGRPLTEMVHADVARDLGHGIHVDHLLCSKPIGGEFADFHVKMVTFAQQLASPAQAINPAATARTGHLVADERLGSSFHYADTAAARAGIVSYADRVRDQCIGIVGLGGSGSYVLDLVSKTPVRMIHLFDNDAFLQHNAFRAPGAPDAETLRLQPSKVAHFDRIYSRMHRGIVPHEIRLGPSTLRLLDGLSFVFLCLDGTRDRHAIAVHLQRSGVPFVDVGMGLYATERGIGGTIRVTTAVHDQQSRIWERNRLPLSDAGADDIYASNVQVAELNALTATLAVIRWKKLFGFYADFEHERFSAYCIDGNLLINEDQVPDEPSRND